MITYHRTHLDFSPDNPNLDIERPTPLVNVAGDNVTSRAANILTFISSMYTRLIRFFFVEVIYR